MKAAVFRRYGPPQVVDIAETPMPLPKEDEVLIRVRAAAINPLDWRVIKGDPRAMRIATGWSKPKDPRIGRDVAGVVEKAGARVTQFRLGQSVFGSCEGALAEYACAKESKLALNPPNVPFEQLASIPIAGYTALQSLRDKGRVKSGQQLLITGAGGGVGTFAVQIAKYFGAEVTGVCGTDKVDLVRSIGADRVIDYTREDYRKQSEKYDIVLDNVGDLSLRECRPILKSHGRCLFVGAPKSISMMAFFGEMAEAFVVSSLGNRKYLPVIARVRRNDLIFLGDLVASGKVRPVIGRRYPLSEAAEALQYLENGHATGKVIVTMDQDLGGE